LRPNLCLDAGCHENGTENEGKKGSRKHGVKGVKEKGMNGCVLCMNR
jgi:hypothetical protein